MKKLFTLFTVLLLCTASTWADPFVPVEGVLYSLKCCSNEAHRENPYLGISNGSLNGQCTKSARAYLKFEPVVGQEGHYYIKVTNVNAGNKYFNWNNGAVLADEAPTEWEFRTSYITGAVALAPVGTDSGKALNNNGGSGTGFLQMGGFTSDYNRCSHWEIIEELAIPEGFNVCVGGTIDLNGWKTASKWILAKGATWNDEGPGRPESGMWQPIYLKDVTATGISLEGWNFRAELDHSTWTIDNIVKIQCGGGVEAYTKLKNSSTVTMTFDNGHTHNYRIDLSEGTGNVFNLVMTNGYKHNCGQDACNNATITVNYGTICQGMNRQFNASGTGNIKNLVLQATLADPSAVNKVEDYPLVTYANVGAENLTVTLSEGWTEVTSQAALEQQPVNGKYYYVDKAETGVTLYTFHETRYVTSDATLRQIASYDNYDRFIVNSGVTLTVDVDDYDLKKITGEGNIILNADAPISGGTVSGSLTVNEGKTLTVNVENFDLTRISGAGNVVLNADASLTGSKNTAATGKLTVNAGKTLTIGGGDSETNSVASFTSIDLKGTIKNNNSTTTLKYVTVPAEATGIIYSYDMGSAADGFLLAGTTTVNGTLYVCNKLNFQMKVDQLTGNGTWTICGTEASDFDADGTSSSDAATVNVASATSFTGSATVRNTNATVNVAGNLVASTWTKSAGTLKYTGTNLAGTTLDGAILASGGRINTSGVVSIKNLAGNDNTAGSHNYALVGGANSTINLFGTCDFTKKSDGTTANTYNYIGYPSSANIVIKAGATVTTNKVFNSGTDNATVTIEEGATLITPEVYSVGISVTGDATLATTATALNISAPVTVAAGKTLTINGGESLATVTIAQTPTLGEDSSINFVNTTIDFNDVRDLSAYAYTFSGCTARFIETGAEYSKGNFTVTNVPDGITTILVKKYDYKSTDDTEYYTATKTGTTATLSHEVGVSGSSAWLDYTFSTETNPTGTNQYIQNYGNAGSNQNLKLDGNYNGNTSFNEDGTLKVKSTPWRDMTWPTDYTVAVSANFPDVENGCLMAFGSSTGGSQNYLALVRGASSNEIKLVKGHGNSTHFTEVATMSAENATASPHLVVFTKQGDVFNVYLDGVNVTQTTYLDALGTGFQVGSLHGGVRAANVAVGGGTGLLRVNDTGVPNEAVYAKAVRVYDYVISDAQMDKLKDEFSYISKGGSYSRAITADANLSASGAWYNQGDDTNVDLPSDAVIDNVTYHPDVEITTSADATLTVNADMNTRNIEFGGSNTLTIAGDEAHHLKVYGSVTANSPVIVRYGSADFSTVPVSVGASGSICFDFSAYDFSSVDETTQYVVTGNTSDYGDQITATPTADQNYLYTLAHNAEENKYILTVAPNIAAKQQQAIDAVTPYYNNRLVGTGVGKYTVKLGETGETSYREMSDFLNAIASWTRLSDCVTPVITINQPTSGYYRILNKGTQRYVNCTKVDDEATHTSAGITGDDAAKTIFYIDEDKNIQAYDNGAYWKGVYRMGRGTFDGGTYGMLTYKHPWQFIEGNSLGTYKLIYGNDTEGKYHPTGSGNATSYAELNNSDAANADAATWTLVAVTELPNRTEAGSTERGNEITYAPAGTTVPASVPNVLVTTAENTYQCNNLQLTDDLISEFGSGTMTSFVETNVTYNRVASANQWGTICLPYAVSTKGDVAYYRLVAPVGNQTLRFERVIDETTTANEPYLIKKAANAGLTISASDAVFSLGDDEVKSTAEHNTYKLQGVMVSTSVINGVAPYTGPKDGYQQAVTDPNAYYFDASSNTFRALNGRFNLKAFRAYLTATGTASADDPANARSILSIDISEEGQATGISFVESEDGKTVDVVFDLNGRRLQEARKGINIINGKKVIK